jgi:hypothetical protein
VCLAEAAGLPQYGSDSGGLGHCRIVISVSGMDLCCANRVCVVQSGFGCPKMPPDQDL